MTPPVNLRVDRKPSVRIATGSNCEPFRIVLCALGGGAALIAVSGEVDLLTAPALLQRLVDAFDQYDHALLDLDGVSYIGATGLGVLLQVQQSSVGRLHIVGGTSSTRRLLHLLGLHKVFCVHRDLTSAIQELDNLRSDGSTSSRTSGSQKVRRVGG